jgi:hypothetical protein
MFLEWHRCWRCSQKVRFQSRDWGTGWNVDRGNRTPYGLYRDGTELRAVYYDKPEVARAACDSMEDQCDYPILLGMWFQKCN